MKKQKKSKFGLIFAIISGGVLICLVGATLRVPWEFGVLLTIALVSAVAAVAIRH